MFTLNRLKLIKDVLENSIGGYSQDDQKEIKGIIFVISEKLFEESQKRPYGYDW